MVNHFSKNQHKFINYGELIFYRLFFKNLVILREVSPQYKFYMNLHL